MISSMLPPFLWHPFCPQRTAAPRAAYAVPLLAPQCLQFEQVLELDAMVRCLSFVPHGALYSRTKTGGPGKGFGSSGSLRASPPWFCFFPVRRCSGAVSPPCWGTPPSHHIASLRTHCSSIGGSAFDTPSCNSNSSLGRPRANRA